MVFMVLSDHCFVHGDVQAGHHARVVITDVQPREAHQLVARIQLRVDARIHGTVQIAVVMQRAVRGEVTADRLQVRYGPNRPSSASASSGSFSAAVSANASSFDEMPGSKRVPASYA